jgi:CDP-glycerol glycerophosphotransferase (TagB/SpsB family)
MYVNNGFTNFQSLAFQQAVHIHLNHGESDKICMVSNQAKAYDKVFVAGPAAVRRHAAAIAWFDITHLARVGRPQLDLPVPNPLTEFAGTTITYAPTWEGEDDANNYTSVDVYGPSIISAALTLTNCRVIYKPHPRVADSNNAAVKASHRKILTLLNSANSHDPNAGHRVMLDANVLGIIRGTDLLIADVSSVTLDHLYLRPQAPIVLCDRHTNRAQLLMDTPVAAGAHILDQDTIATLATDLADIIANDQQEAARGELRDFYFDGLEPGQSTERFWQQTRIEISEHDRALQELSRVRQISEGEA